MSYTTALVMALILSVKCSNDKSKETKPLLAPARETGRETGRDTLGETARADDDIDIQQRGSLLEWMRPWGLRNIGQMLKKHLSFGDDTAKGVASYHGLGHEKPAKIKNKIKILIKVHQYEHGG